MRKRTLVLLFAMLFVLSLFPMAAQASEEYFALSTQQPGPGQEFTLKYHFRVEEGQKYSLGILKDTLTPWDLRPLGFKNLSSEISGGYVTGQWTVKAPDQEGKYQIILVGPKPASDGFFATIGCYVADGVDLLTTDPVTGVGLTDVSSSVVSFIVENDPITGGIINALGSLLGGDDENEKNTVLYKIPLEVKVNVHQAEPAGPPTSGTPESGTTSPGTSGPGTPTPGTSGPGIPTPGTGSTGTVDPGTGTTGVGTGTPGTGTPGVGPSMPGTGGSPVNAGNTTNNLNQNTNTTTNNANTSINITGSTVSNSNIGSNNQVSQTTTNNNSITVTQYVTVMIDGQPLQSDVKPFVNADGRTMLPVRPVAEALGAQVQWDEGTQTATLTQGGKNVKVPVGQKTISVDGKPVAMDTAAVVKDGRTLLPVRPIAEALGVKIDWDEATSTVQIETDSEVAPKILDTDTGSAGKSLTQRPAEVNYNPTGGIITNSQQAWPNDYLNTTPDWWVSSPSGQEQMPGSWNGQAQ